MPIYDYRCAKCEKVTESVQNLVVVAIKCSECGEIAWKIFSPMGTVRFADDAAWLKTVIEVVDKDSKAPHVVAFFKDPTRSNYKAWMKGEGLRPRDPTERPHKMSEKEERADHQRRTDYAMQRHVERKRLEVR
jgi:putative FmdB family regulatory protein